MMPISSTWNDCCLSLSGASATKGSVAYALHCEHAGSTDLLVSPMMFNRRIADGKLKAVTSYHSDEGTPLPIENWVRKGLGGMKIRLRVADAALVATAAALLYTLLSDKTLPSDSQASISECGAYGPGTYLVTADLSSTGTCLQLNGDVTLLIPHAHKIVGPGPGGEEPAYGVEHRDGRLRVSGGGKITGFRAGVVMNGAGGVVSGPNLCGNTYFGVWVNGPDNTVRRNYICNIGGERDEAYAIGVHCGDAPNCIVEGNIFRNLYRQTRAPKEMAGEGVAINFSAGMEHGVARYNLAVNDRATMNSYCAFGGAGGGHTFENNVCRNYWRSAFDDAGEPSIRSNIVTIDAPLPGSIGISFDGNNVAGNTVVGPFETPITATEHALRNNLVVKAN